MDAEFEKYLAERRQQHTANDLRRQSEERQRKQQERDQLRHDALSVILLRQKEMIEWTDLPREERNLFIQLFEEILTTEVGYWDDLSRSLYLAIRDHPGRKEYAALLFKKYTGAYREEVTALLRLLVTRLGHVSADRLPSPTSPNTEILNSKLDGIRIPSTVTAVNQSRQIADRIADTLNND